MPREELPSESTCALGYDELIDMLRRIEGEEVYVTTGRFTYANGFGFLLGAQGILSGPSEYRDSMRFSLLPPDQNARYAGELSIPRPGFRSATLRTFDGNDFFHFSVVTDDGTLVIADEGSGP